MKQRQFNHHNLFVNCWIIYDWPPGPDSPQIFHFPLFLGDDLKLSTNWLTRTVFILVIVGRFSRKATQLIEHIPVQLVNKAQVCWDLWERGCDDKSNIWESAHMSDHFWFLISLDRFCDTSSTTCMKNTSSLSGRHAIFQAESQAAQVYFTY